MSGVRQCRPPLVQEVRYVPAQIGNQHSPYSFYIFLCRNNPGHYAMLGSPFPSYHHRYPKQKFTPSLCLPPNSPTKPQSPCPPRPTTPPESLHRTKQLIPKPQKPRITILPHCLPSRQIFRLRPCQKHSRYQLLLDIRIRPHRADMVKRDT
jgi:hypothetical protein